MVEEPKRENRRETRQVEINQNSPEILTNAIYTPGFLRQQITISTTGIYGGSNQNRYPYYG